MGFGKFFKQFGSLAVGIAAGFLIGPLAFNPLSFSIGSLIGGFLFNRPPKIEPNHLDSLNIGGSSYGTPIPILYGAVKLAGNIIDARPENAIVEVRNRDRYDWFLTCEVLFCEALDGPRVIDKLWGYTPDNEMVLYDRHAVNPVTSLPWLTPNPAQGFQLTLDESTGMESGAWPNSPAQKLVLKRGTGTQTVVPQIAALHGGIGCPYRWQTTATFIDLPLGNSNGEGWRGVPPTFKALVRDERTGVRKVIKAHLVRGGVPCERIDLSGIPADKSFDGYVMQAKEPSRDLCDKVAALAFCDLVQVDGGIRASDRTAPTIVALDAGELRAHHHSEEMPPTAAITVGADIDLPSKLTLRFIDPDLDYQPNSVTVLRQVVEDVNERTIEVPVVLKEGPAKVIAQTMLDEAWAARTPYKFSLLPGRIALAPGDVVDLPLNNTVRRLRITGQTIGAPGAISCDAVTYDSEVYDQPQPTTGTTRPPSTVPVYGEPLLVAFDANAARDEDINSGGGFYAGYTIPAGANAFRQVTLSPMPQSALFIGFGSYTFRRAAVVGTAVNALPAFSSSGDFDRTNTLVVDIHEKLSLAGVEEADLLDDANKAVLKWGTTNWEYLNFAQAAKVAGAATGYQRYELSTLLRGQRGTEPMMAGHAAGNQFILMDDAIERVRCGLPAIGRTLQLYRDNLYLETVTIYGNSLKPFSPVHINTMLPVGTTAWRDGSNNLTIAFGKRSKYTDLSLQSGHPPTNAPGDNDAFGIDIMSGATVVRTITTSTTALAASGATLFTATYSAAAQTVDGFTPGDPVTVRIYQTSSIITRGYSAVAAI